MLSIVMLCVIMLNVIILSVVLLSAFMLSVIMLSANMLRVVMLSVVMLIVVTLNVVAPFLSRVLVVGCLKGCNHWRPKKCSDDGPFHITMRLLNLQICFCLVEKETERQTE